MSPSHGRIDNLPIEIGRNEEMLDHAVSTQQLDAIQKQLWIRRNALANGVRQLEPLLAVVTAPGVFIRLEQRHQILNQQGEIKGIGVAGVQDQARLISRRSRLHGVVTDLRPQVPGSHANAGLVDFKPVLFRKSRHLLRDCKIGRQFVGGGALRQLDQPARISHKDRLIGRCECPKPVEHALNLRQPIAGVARSAIPQAHA